MNKQSRTRNRPMRAAWLAPIAVAAIVVTACAPANAVGNDPANDPANGPASDAATDTSTSSSAVSPSSADSGATALSGTLNGAGSSAQQAAMQVWRAGFIKANPGATVNYDPIGSGGGREQFLSGGVAFAGSDDYMSTDELAAAKQRCQATPIEIPVYVSPIAVVFNVPGVDSLNLDPATIAGIFVGEITNWNAEQVAAQNPDVALPDLRITPIHRSDESGTTGNFTDYLAQAAPAVWTHGAVENWPITSGGAADGTGGVVAAVQQGEGTIGYADASQTHGMTAIKVLVGSGYVAPTPEAAAAILDESTRVEGRSELDFALELDRTPEADGVYPIVLVSYQIMCSAYDDPATAALVEAFESYVVSAEGQQAAAEFAGSAPLTDTMRQQALTAIDQISDAR